MSLTKYNEKRSFDDTPEPKGGKSKTGQLIFVIQKHDATRLHYDFRLEMEGVLKSWAVPKGPSLNPADKRLAMMVEDHPFDYKDFEGIIPKGNYGAGTVIVWDYGTYTPIEPVRSKKEAEKLLLKQLAAGSVKIVLNGKKVKGEFALVHTKGRGDSAWLLIKHRDKFARETDITSKDKSVISGKTIAKMERKPDRVYGQKASGVQKKAAAPVKAKAKAELKEATAAPKAKRPVKKKAPSIAKLPDGAIKRTMPKTVSPMLATLVDKAVEEPGWVYEVKWDGYRAVSLCKTDQVELISRNNKSFNEKFYPVHDALRALGRDAVLDGEITVVKSDGVSNFGALQNWRSEADGDLVYYVFDVLWLNGYDLMELPLTKRRELLHPLLPEEGIIRESQSFDVPPGELLAAAAELGLEGIIAKKGDSNHPYLHTAHG
ncbi:MAG TPA: DNA polymerase ligase N-terminal domain-containing protein [Puia sp.]|jgi:bifunctional non-homologous end joining protein LigD